MFEHNIWCPSRFYFRASFISNIYCRSFLFELWSRFFKLYTIPYICRQDFNGIIKLIERNVNKLFNWFQQNGLLANSGKSHFLTGPYERSLKIHDSIITSSSSEELMGVLNDSELTFHDRITRLCSKANQKLNPLDRVSKYVILQKWRLVMSSYVTSQFNYCPLVWMIHNRKLNQKISKIQERALGIVYSDHNTSFSELLKIDKSVTIHKKKLAIFTYWDL